MNEHTYRDDDFTLREDVRDFLDEADYIIDGLYKKGEERGFNYRDVYYLLSYLVNKYHRVKLYREEIANL